MTDDNEIIDHTCPVCKAKYRGERGKSKCYDCYKTYRSAKRIEPLNQHFSRHEAIYLCHPSVTAEELNAWIEAKGLEAGWGARELDLSKYKLFFDNTKFD